MEIWLAAESKLDTQHWARICQPLGDKVTEHWTSWVISSEDRKNPASSGEWQAYISMYWAFRLDICNDIRQQPGEEIHSLGQRVMVMMVKCAWNEEEQQGIIEIMMHGMTYYKVRVKLYVLELKDIDLDEITTEGVKT